MFPKKIFLTIDDSPSRNTKKIVKYLSNNSIPAIFFCRGEFIAQRPEDVAFIIEHGFLVGNHSYTHPYFSNISIQQCIEEINKTENLIEECYQKVDLKRSKKIIRLPFGDRGAGKWARYFSTNEEKDKVESIQEFLKNSDFESVFSMKGSENFMDTFWDWDTQDYKKKFISSPKNYLANLEVEWSKITCECPVMLVHDFDTNYELFEVTMDFLKKNDILCEQY